MERRSRNHVKLKIYTDAVIEVVLRDVCVIFYKHNIHNTVAAAHASTTHGNKKNQTVHVSVCPNMSCCLLDYYKTQQLHRL